MVPVAIGTFHHQIVCSFHDIRIVDDGPVAPAKIPGKGHADGFILLGDPYLDGRAAHQVPHVGKAGLHARANLHHRAIGDTFKTLASERRVLDAIQGLRRRLASPQVLTGLLLRILLLDVCAIRQHDLT